MISSFCGTWLHPGGTTEKPKNMKTRMSDVRSGRFLLKQTYTFLHSSFSSANSSSATKLSREPCGSTLDGMSTYKMPLTRSVFHSTSFSSLSEHLKLTRSELDDALSAMSSKSMNSLNCLVVMSSWRCVDSLDDVDEDDDDDDVDDDDDCFRLLLLFIFSGLLACLLLLVFKLPTLLPFVRHAPPRCWCCMSNSAPLWFWDDVDWDECCRFRSAVVLVEFIETAWVKSGIILRPCSQTNT